MYLMYPLSSNNFSALCVVLGTAFSNLMSIFGLIPCFSRVQTPFGPRKSGIPQLVEIPAPVWTTMYFEFLEKGNSMKILKRFVFKKLFTHKNKSTNFSIFSFTTLSSSNISAVPKTPLCS